MKKLFNVCVYSWHYARANMWRSQDSFWELVLFFYQVDTRGQTQVIRLGIRYPALSPAFSLSLEFHPAIPVHAPSLSTHWLGSLCSHYCGSAGLCVRGAYIHVCTCGWSENSLGGHHFWDRVSHWSRAQQVGRLTGWPVSPRNLPYSHLPRTGL